MSDLQKRVDDALRETPEDEEASLFSEYRDSSSDLTEKLMRAAREGGASAALDEFEKLRPAENIRRLQRALMEFIVHDPSAAEAGLRIPSLEERAAWKVAHDADPRSTQ